MKLPKKLTVMPSARTVPVRSVVSCTLSSSPISKPKTCSMFLVTSAPVRHAENA